MQLHRRVQSSLAVVFAALATFLLSAAATAALTPASLTLTDTNGPLAFSGGPYLVANPSSQATGTPTCNAALPCDELTLTVSVSDAARLGKYVRVSVGWPVELAQIDLYVLQGTKLVAASNMRKRASSVSKRGPAAAPTSRPIRRNTSPASRTREARRSADKRPS